MVAQAINLESIFTLSFPPHSFYMKINQVLLILTPKYPYYLSSVCIFFFLFLLLLPNFSPLLFLNKASAIGFTVPTSILSRPLYPSKPLQYNYVTLFQQCPIFVSLNSQLPNSLIAPFVTWPLLTAFIFCRSFPWQC